jgi:hypothetical protein
MGGKKGISPDKRPFEGNGLCSFCLDTKRTKKVKAAEKQLKLFALSLQKINSSRFQSGLKQNFLRPASRSSLLTLFFRGR